MKDYKQILENAKGMVEATKKSTGKLKDACWKGFTAVGTKTKGGRTVPNCVPIKNSFEVDGDSLEEVTTKANKYVKMSDKDIVSGEMHRLLGLALQTLQGALGEQDMTDVRYTKRVGIEINSERHSQLMLALERELKKAGSKLQMWNRKKGQDVGGYKLGK